jgi:hypothetical protein
MNLNVVDNKGMRSFSGILRLVFDNDPYPVDITVEELRQLVNPLGLQDKVDLKVRFNKFWEKYNHKVKKEDALKVYLKLKPAEHQAIEETLDDFLASIPDKKFLPMPSTYLRGKRWQDELTDPVKKTTAPAWVKKNDWGK